MEEDKKETKGGTKAKSRASSDSVANFSTTELLHFQRGKFKLTTYTDGVEELVWFTAISAPLSVWTTKYCVNCTRGTFSLPEISCNRLNGQHSKGSWPVLRSRAKVATVESSCVTTASKTNFRLVLRASSQHGRGLPERPPGTELSLTLSKFKAKRTKSLRPRREHIRGWSSLFSHNNEVRQCHLDEIPLPGTELFQHQPLPNIYNKIEDKPRRAYDSLTPGTCIGQAFLKPTLKISSSYQDTSKSDGEKENNGSSFDASVASVENAWKEETIESDSSTIKFMDRTMHKLNAKGKNVKENNNGEETLTAFLKRILTTLGALFRT
ncbi:hypothetical protein WN51_08486 [Melipona quadrifasciata]|uniref:Uncharacterized protein n=1 Tax=Melipona quadrifasciata TaxID=166423 RepID=A0A0M9A7D7_9HYME|nr:hypothetical protein WN51_08486 [Melipona quadrifasciata]